MDLNDEMLDMMKFYEFYKKMRAYENKNEFTEKIQEINAKTEGANEISKKILQKIDGAILNDKKEHSKDEIIKEEGKKKNYKATRPLEIEEYEEIIRKDKTIYGDNKEEVEDLINKVQTDEQLKNFAPDLMKVMFGLAQVRHLAILTLIDDDVYDIVSAKFENLPRNKIVHFDNLTTLYNESNARVRYFTPEEEPQLTQRTVLVDIDDESIIQAYENEHIHQEESEDLTSDFFTEVKGKPYTLKRK